MNPASCVVFVCGLFICSISSPDCVLGTSNHRITVQDELGRTWNVAPLFWFVVVLFFKNLIGKTEEDIIAAHKFSENWTRDLTSNKPECYVLNSHCNVLPFGGVISLLWFLNADFAVGEEVGQSTLVVKPVIKTNRVFFKKLICIGRKQVCDTVWFSMN